MEHTDVLITILLTPLCSRDVLFCARTPQCVYVIHKFKAQYSILNDLNLLYVYSYVNKAKTKVIAKYILTSLIKIISAIETKAFIKVLLRFNYVDTPR